MKFVNFFNSNSGGYKMLSKKSMGISPSPTLAIDAKLPNAFRKDSQGICFLGKINYNDFIRRHLGEKKGNIIELETGKKIGEHKGFWFHTIGQRKGLGLSGGPWFVVKKNVQDNTIYARRLYLKESLVYRILKVIWKNLEGGRTRIYDCKCNADFSRRENKKL